MFKLFCHLKPALWIKKAGLFPYLFPFLALHLKACSETFSVVQTSGFCASADGTFCASAQGNRLSCGHAGRRQMGEACQAVL